MKKQNINQLPVTSVQTPAPKSIDADPIGFVVVRDGHRVSDREYNVPNDPDAVAEQDFWYNIANKHSYGESVEIVQYESKKHRVW